MNIGNYESLIKRDIKTFNDLRQNNKDLIKLRNSLDCTSTDKIKEINIKIRKNNEEANRINDVIDCFKKIDLDKKMRTISFYHFSIIGFLIALCVLILFI